MRAPAIAIAIVLLAAPARADWEQELVEDIRYELDCEVAFLTQVVVRLVDGERIILAKVRCEDGRTFDARRDSDYSLFTFSPCRKERVAC